MFFLNLDAAVLPALNLDDFLGTAVTVVAVTVVVPSAKVASAVATAITSPVDLRGRPVFFLAAAEGTRSDNGNDNGNGNADDDDDGARGRFGFRLVVVFVAAVAVTGTSAITATGMGTSGVVFVTPPIVDTSTASLGGCGRVAVAVAVVVIDVFVDAVIDTGTPPLPTSTAKDCEVMVLMALVLVPPLLVHCVGCSTDTATPPADTTPTPAAASESSRNDASSPSVVVEVTVAEVGSESSTSTMGLLSSFPSMIEIVFWNLLIALTVDVSHSNECSTPIV